MIESVEPLLLGTVIGIAIGYGCPACAKAVLSRFAGEEYDEDCEICAERGEN